MGLAVSIPTLPVGLACHGRSSEHMGENEMSLLTGGEKEIFVHGDDLKVCPTNVVDRFSDQEPGGRRPHLKHLVQMLQGGSSSCVNECETYHQIGYTPGGQDFQTLLNCEDTDFVA